MRPDAVQPSIVAALKQHRIEAFEALYALHHQAVFRNICKLVSRQEVAEDILQEVFLTLWEKRASLDESKDVAGWLFVVSYNKSTMWLKRNLRESLALETVREWYSDDEETGRRDAIYQEQVLALNQAVEQLPDRKKQAFYLCRMEGRTYEEAGELLNVSPASIQKYVNSAAQLIRGKLVSTQQDPSSLTAIAGLILMVALS